MPRYIVERNVGTVTQEELDAVGRRSNAVLVDMPDVVWIKSYVSAAEGKIYCEYEAPNPEATPVATSRIKAGNCSATAGSAARAVPSSITRSESTLRCVPPAMRPMEITAGATGSMRRVHAACRAWTTAQAAVMASTP